ncbi:hypothetical protein FQA39_LY15057 [Lamprigera yunnana]|nr:hypothetical protein FQA39_LY15057 [Lamprigera yunnana]
MVSLSLYNILTYIGTGSRPLIEGEAVLNAGHVIMCGVNIENHAEIIALCQQTSQLKGTPHSIKMILNSLVPQEWNCVCSCKAGAGGRCKQLVACLLFMNRNSLEELSCTDLEQAWGKRKDGLNNLEVEPLQNFCHVKQVKLPVAQDIDPSISSNTIELLLIAIKDPIYKFSANLGIFWWNSGMGPIPDQVRIQPGDLKQQVPSDYTSPVVISIVKRDKRISANLDLNLKKFKCSENFSISLYIQIKLKLYVANLLNANIIKSEYKQKHRAN